MRIRDVIDKLRLARANIIQNREADALRITLDQLALVKRRVTLTGTDSSGNKFLPYAPSYAANRKKAGYQTSFVDFTRTGALWLDIKPITIEASMFICKVEVGAQSENGKIIFSALARLRGNYIKPSVGEIAITKEANSKRLKSYFQNIF